MPVVSTCPQGHQYESAAGSCPVCAGTAAGATLVDPTELPARDPEVTADHFPGQTNGTTTTPAPTPQPTADEQPRPQLTEMPSEANQYTRLEPGAGPGAARSAMPTLGMIAGYELLDILGRGGMGIVYKARQKKLNRLVALKMILAGAHASRTHLARFQTEAKAVASLQHPNIVQIHEIAEHEGQPYLALEFVDGPSLDKQFAGKPQDPREAARLIATLARAVELAHEHGIVHRDLKPPNILIQKTGSGAQGSGIRKKPDSKTSGIIRKTITPLDLRAPSMGVPKITDFGLAKQMDTEDSNTVTGAIMGTPSYMAPEQATGKTHEIGPPADIYSLGAILYEALTGRPPFAGVTPLDTLRQVQTQEPVPPTRLQPKLPRDLETICLKCLEKEPARRYESAEELGDDLERFLAGEPIQARPVSLWMRGVKWARRRPGMATLIGVSAVATVALLSVIGWSYVALSVSYAREQAERQHAVRNAQKARKAVDELLRAVADELEDVPMAEKTRRTLLEKALGFYQDFLEEKSDDAVIRQELARTLKQVGDIYYYLGEQGKSQEHYDKMLTLAAELPEPVRQQPAFVRDVAAAHSGRSLSLKATAEKLSDAVTDARTALQLQQSITPATGSSAQERQDLARYHYFLGVALAANPGGFAEAEQQYHHALRLQNGLVEQPSGVTTSQRRELARTLNNLGLLQSRTKRPQAALTSFERARDLQQALANEFPEKPAYRRELARTFNNLAVLLLADNKLPEAQQAYDQVRTLLDDLVRDFPSVPDYRNELGMCHANEAILARRLRRFEQAHKSLQQALETQRKLAAEFPKVADYRQRLGRTLVALGNLQRDQRQEAEAEAAYREAVQIFEHLLADARTADHHNGLAVARFGLSQLLHIRPVCLPLADYRLPLGVDVLTGLEQFDQLDHLHRAIDHQTQALRLNAQNTQYRIDLCNYHVALAKLQISLGEHAGAARSANTMAELMPEDKDQAYRGALWLAFCVATAQKDMRLSDSERTAVADGYAEQAVAFLRRAIAQGYKNTEALSKPPFDVLQPYPEFRNLREQLEEKTTKVITRK